MLKQNIRLAAAGLGAAMAFTASCAFAQDVTIKLHEFLPAQAGIPKHISHVWADRIEEASEGRIKVDRFSAMQLGGAPPELYDQVVDGVADVVWTVAGYTPGRFPATEVFELPFFVDDAQAASYAYWKLYEEEMQDQFSDTHVLGTWVHGPGLIHSSDPVETPDDMRGLKIRGASRQVNALLQTLGAESVGMPVPAVPEALSKGVIDGTTIPWEVTGALKTSELVENHTEFEGPMLYTVTFVMAMNQEVYDSLPEDLKKVVDDNSGLDFSVFAAGEMVSLDGPARQIAVDLGNNIIELDASASAQWADAAAPVKAAWLADMEGRGIDGQALIDRATELMTEYQNSN